MYVSKTRWSVDLQKLAKNFRTGIVPKPVELLEYLCKSKKIYMYGSKKRWSVDLPKACQKNLYMYGSKSCWIAEISLQEQKFLYVWVQNALICWFAKSLAKNFVHVWLQILVNCRNLLARANFFICMGPKRVDLLICQKLVKNFRTCIVPKPVELHKYPCKSKKNYMSVS